ncbi:MAG: putative bifunctional diguanylate cyclase/phosphodiesterase [Cellulomonas sp.]
MLVWTMVVVLVAYSGGLLAHDHLPSFVVDSVLGLLTAWLPVAVCALAASRVTRRRPEVLLATAALTVSATADSMYAWMAATTPEVPFPSAADALYLLFYALLLAALVTAVRRDVHGMASAVWLDGAVGSLGAAALLAVLLSPVLDAALTEPLSPATAMAVAYPMFDVALVAAVAGVSTLNGVRVGGRWALLIAGLLIYAMSDVVYALQVNAGSYVVGSLLDGAWSVGLMVVALWVDAAAHGEAAGTPTHENPEMGARALVISALATAMGLGVLVMSSRVAISALGVVLATATLLAAAARTQVAFRQLVRMADLRRQATADELTGLPNRRALYTDGQAALVRSSEVPRALLMLDLDKFKEVNDSLGHHAGDALLVQVGTRLREHVRDGDLLARLGGDEFAVLLADADHARATAVAAKLRAVLAEPFTLEGLALHSSVSIGIAVFPEDGPDLSTLLRKADIAMYKAKTSGDGHHAYDRADDADGANRLGVMEELRTALTSDQLVLHYQPKIDLDTGDVRSVEALVRWDHPTRGLLYPDAFLTLVEEAGLMRTMTRLVLEMALDQIATWQAQGQAHLTVAVNLSASSLVDADLPDQVAAMLAARGVPPRSLQVEITEEFLMADRDRARKILTRLRDSGVQIAVDDFGTGYSSLSYLRDLPIDELKLDRTFVFPMADDARAAALVASTIDLAHSLGLRMVAEGVETDVAYTELARLGCDQAQGYLMSRPVPAAELEHWLTTRTPRTNPTDGTSNRVGPPVVTTTSGRHQQ